jgi:hypothetical protein
VGHVNGDGAFRIRGLKGGVVVACDVAGLVQAWQSAEVV